MLGLNSFIKKVFGTANERFIKSLQLIVDAVNSLETEFEKLSDKQLRDKTDEFRNRLKEEKETLDDILPEAFATVREAAKRTLGQRHFDVQLVGGIVLHKGMIAEMKTGEGKTLVATLASYLNALEGKGVHVVTVNDYLAKRDSEWMGQIYKFLGLTVGCIVHGIRDDERKEAYTADITYGTNNEYGFDYLRDNMKFSIEQMVQRPFNFAIVDEVDSILIDEARTPLIISGPVEDNTDLYVRINKYIPKLEKQDFELDEKAKTVTFTDEGTTHLEEMLTKDGLLKQDDNLYDLGNISLVHHANQALRAHKIFEKDKDYIVKDNRVIIIDEFTGRMMEGRRYSEGLHQALEAKENAHIQNENQTLASITFQNYFRLYSKLAGMTGTAMTEAEEFSDIYHLDSVEIPTNVPVARIDDDDDIYRTREEKYAAIINLIKECNKKKQPVLAGTVSIEQSEHLSKVLKKEKIKHNVLNARYHEQEAYIISQAGQPGAITIATNMAGRGTDIQLGGNVEMLLKEKLDGVTDNKKIEEITKKTKKEVEDNKKIVIEAGGLCVIGSERHESRRIDNQLRGRSGRQGDPGYSKFFLSAQDDLIRIFGADKKMDWVLGTMGEPGEPITHPLITRMMEKSQQKVEARNYEIRKNLLKFDDVMNDQRKVIFEQRIDLMTTEDVSGTIEDMREELVEELVSIHIPEKSYHEQWQAESLETEILRIFGISMPVVKWANEEGIADKEILERINNEVKKLFEEKEKNYGEKILRDVEKKLLLFTLDELWKDHLLSLDHLRQGINLRAYGQKDPLNEYKREAFMAFESMLNSLREAIITRLSHMEMRPEEGGVTIFDKRSQPMHESRRDPALGNSEPTREHTGTIVKNKPAEEKDPLNPETWGKVGRNEPCPCGSGKKYKQCHGKIA